MILNLKAENDCQQAIKDYLQANVSEILANKINNGVNVEKDGKSLVNKKTLSQFWSYATKKAQEMKTGYVKNETVYGWAIHYFEESDIIGTLYNEDGSEYAPPKPAVKPTSTPIISSKPEKPKPAQASFFDFLSTEETSTKDEPAEEKIEKVSSNNYEDNELQVNMETGEVLNATPFNSYKPTSIYQRYLDIEKQYPHAVIAYRLGDFYEVFGDRAIVTARELSLTLTGRDCGLAERVPMIGFPYHASDTYFNKIRQRRKLVIIENDGIQVLDKYSSEEPKPIPVEIPKVEPTFEEVDEDNLENLRAQNKHIDKDALCVLLELFNYELDVQ